MVESSEISNGAIGDDVSFRFVDLASVALCVVLTLVLRKVVFSVGALPEAAFTEAALVPAVFRECLRSPALCGLICLGVVLRRRFLVTWSNAFSLPEIRWFAVGLSTALAATFATQDANLYFDQHYNVDRFLLLGLVLLVSLRPVFILPFVIHAIAFGGQVAVPMSDYGWDEHLLGIYRLPIHLLLAIFAGALLHGQGEQGRRRAVRTTVILCFVIVAAGYWVPGITKFRMEWASVPNVHYSFFGAWCHGWQQDISAAEVLSLTHRIAPYAVSLQWATVVFECAALFVLWRRVSMPLMIVWCIFHLGALALYGYAFWLWICIDLSLFVFLLRRRQVFDAFRWQHLFLALLLVATSGRWLSPNRLAWFNSRLANTYQFVAVTSEDRRVELPSKFFAPYDYQFTMNWFEYLSTKSQVTGPYATTMDSRVATLTGEQILEKQEMRGRKERDMERTAELTKFLSTFAGNWNRRRTSAGMFGSFQPPALLNTTHAPARILSTERIAAIEVVRIRSVMLSDRIDVNPTETCLRVSVPQND